MRREINANTPAERLRSFLEIEEDELAQMSFEELQEELRLLGVNPDEFLADIRSRMPDALSDSESLRSSSSLTGSEVSNEVEIHLSGLEDRRLGANPFSGGRFQQIGLIASSFFQFFSKTDRVILAHCSRAARMSQTSIGAMVFLTGVLAGISGAYAIYMTFKSVAVALPAGVLYGSMIVALDRETVSFKRKTALIPGLLLAVFVGLVISVPLELRFFETRINEQLALSRVNEEKAIVERHIQARGDYEARITALDNDIKDYRYEIMRSMELMADETVGRVRTGRTGRSGRGLLYAQAERLKQNYQELLAQSEMQRQELVAARAQEFDMAEREASVRTQSAASDFLSRFEALERIKATSPVALMVWGFRLLMILIQISPILLLLLMPANDYIAVLEAERRKAIARINAIANDQLGEIVNNPYSVPLPITQLAFGVKGQHKNTIGGEQAIVA